MTTTTERKTLALADRATIYRQGSFGMGYHKIEARDVVVSCGRYAQYDHALFIEFTQKGNRTRQRMVLDYKPSAVILDGWGHFEPADGFVQTAPNVKESQYASFDERYAEDFAADLAGYLIDSRAEIVFDCRGWNSYSGGHE